MYHRHFPLLSVLTAPALGSSQLAPGSCPRLKALPLAGRLLRQPVHQRLHLGQHVEPHHPAVRGWQGRSLPGAAPSSMPTTMPRTAESPPQLALAISAASRSPSYLRAKYCNKPVREEAEGEERCERRAGKGTSRLAPVFETKDEIKGVRNGEFMRARGNSVDLKMRHHRSPPLPRKPPAHPHTPHTLPRARARTHADSPATTATRPRWARPCRS